ncbi:hypothetical protein DFJ58DRAFT_846030 [Suillus subalutaceus]|uniref:uncharacterized protein n=1 Tax=Suillus subalutaceus TaxID=48586 RepID=UPI001B877E23|nr:uncharacterized protein DFJ58DRAFT_846030 [Suillus subalutaceus]KAG1838529.1 hypothetical protein DFJ58DRAFT_846030 [Suillus subalutaceus]
MLSMCSFPVPSLPSVPNFERSFVTQYIKLIKLIELVILITVIDPSKTSCLEGRPGRSHVAAPVGLKTLLGVPIVSLLTCQSNRTCYFRYVFFLTLIIQIQTLEFFIMPNALMMFKADPTLRASWLQSFDAYAVAVQGNLVITMPNMDFVPQFHHFEEENVQAHADWCFSVVNCFQWPQAYDNIFCNSVCIPCKEFYPFPHPLHWAWFTLEQKDFKAIPGNSFPVGTLASNKVEGLELLLSMADKRVQDWRANRQGKKDVIINRVVSLRHSISRLKTHPLTFCDLLIFVMDTQHLFLEIQSFMDWVLITQPRISSGIGANPVNSAWMGAFTHDSDMCNKLHMAGIPIWYVRMMAYIPAHMKVIKPVLITHPDDIVISMYAEGNKIRPYDIIYRGQGGHQCQLHIRCLYGGTTFKHPDGPVASSASTSSFSMPSSSTPAPCSQPSAAGKAPQKSKNKHKRQQPYAREAWPTQPSQSGESRDKWKDPESPYLPPSILHWDDALKTCTKDPSCVHMPYAIDRGYRFPEPALLLGPRLPERLQGYIATWLACRPLWIGRVDHDPPHNYPSPQLWRDFLGSGLTAQSQGAAPKGKDPEKKGLTAVEKLKSLVLTSLRLIPLCTLPDCVPVDSSSN